MWTPFYFFGMPFVFADPGVKQEALGQKDFQGQKYDVIKITFAAGTGDAPDDYYIAYVDPASGQLKLSVYVVTYASDPERQTGRAARAARHRLRRMAGCGRFQGSEIGRLF